MISNTDQCLDAACAPIRFSESCNLSKDEATRTCEYDDGWNSVQPSSHVVKDVKRLTAWTVHVPLGSRIACLDQTSSRMPCPSVARERLDGDICSWLACWGQNASRVAVALYSCHYASGSNNKRNHLDEVEILVEIQEIGDTASLVVRLLTLGQQMCPHCLAFV